MNASSALHHASRPVPRTAAVSFAKGWAVFLKAALANPRSVGAVIPSFPELSRRMAALSTAFGAEDFIELGAGTGSVTEALLRRGIPPRKLVVVERDPELADVLRTRFPGLRVVCGDAAEIRRALPRALARRGFGAVVSSLPLRCLPADKVRDILGEIASLLQPRGRWIQYTYALADRRLPDGFHRVDSSLVWKNVPPARIDVLARRDSS